MFTILLYFNKKKRNVMNLNHNYKFRDFKFYLVHHNIFLSVEDKYKNEAELYYTLFWGLK